MQELGVELAPLKNAAGACRTCIPSHLPVSTAFSADPKLMSKFPTGGLVTIFRDEHGVGGDHCGLGEGREIPGFPLPEGLKGSKSKERFLVLATNSN